MSFSELDTIGICIDEYNDGEMKGRLFSPLSEEPRLFNSVITLVKHISNIFDEGDFPQATMKCRVFNKEAKVTPPTPKPIIDPSKFSPARTNIHGRKATFRVKVMFRQNASWQGTLTWVEKNREENFRSVLEMLMLIDSSFDAERAAMNDSDTDRLSANM